MKSVLNRKRKDSKHEKWARNSLFFLSLWEAFYLIAKVIFIFFILTLRHCSFELFVLWNLGLFYFSEFQCNLSLSYRRIKCHLIFFLFFYVRFDLSHCVFLLLDQKFWINPKSGFLGIQTISLFLSAVLLLLYPFAERV